MKSAAFFCLLLVLLVIVSLSSSKKTSCKKAEKKAAKNDLKLLIKLVIKKQQKKAAKKNGVKADSAVFSAGKRETCIDICYHSDLKYEGNFLASCTTACGNFYQIQTPCSFMKAHCARYVDDKRLACDATTAQICAL